MVFSSLEFLFMYMPVMLAAYFAVPAKYIQWRNLVLLAVSLIFYGWGEPIYVFIMVFSICVDYTCGYFVDKFRDRRKLAKRFVIASVIINLSVLGFFKYFDFFISILQNIPFLSGLKPLGLALPIGISFYTFQTMSYTLDIYMGTANVQRNIASFGAYVTLFPQLIAGPIVRYCDVDEMLRSRSENVALFASGVRTFFAGMGKKLLFANTAGAMWSHFQAMPAGQRTVVGAWVGLIFYAFQIYFDFSGYSDMAIGLGKMIGFRFLENFNYPYIAKSITDFWRRWHISLSTWFREYVYIPLGGNRCSTLKNFRNLLVVWFLTGFWHGACWNYIIWGLYYFVILALEKSVLKNAIKRMPSGLAHLYSTVLILIGWLIFVFEDSAAGLVYMKNMVGIGAPSFISVGDIYDILRNLLFIAILVIAATPLPKKLFYRLYTKFTWWRVLTCIGCAAVFVLAMAYLVDSSFNPFLYFRF